MVHRSVRPSSVLVVLLALVALSGLAACQNTRDGLEKDSAENAAKAREGAAELKEDVKDGAERAAEATAVAIDDAGRKAAAASRTFAVKAALMADTRVDASHVDVDSDGDALIVHLRGTVPTAQDKAVAETIAIEKADGWKISNELTLAAKSS